MKVFTIAFTTKDTVDIAEYFGAEMENNVNKSNLPHRQLRETETTWSAYALVKIFSVILGYECNSYDDYMAPLWCACYDYVEIHQNVSPGAATTHKHTGSVLFLLHF